MLAAVAVAAAVAVTAVAAVAAAGTGGRANGTAGANGTSRASEAARADGTAGASEAGGFPLLTARPAPAGWRSLALPDGTAVLSYPPALHLVEGDSDSVSVAETGPAGAYLLYLNATPRQGAETLRNWATFRVGLLMEDDARSARVLASATGVHLLGGIASCVLDSYVTRIGGHHFTELACLAAGHAGESVIVAAAPSDRWASAKAVLEQAVAAYRTR